MLIDHGGNLDQAIKSFGGDYDSWIDLSTGINPLAYPVPELPASAFSDLPKRSDLNDLLLAAQTYYETSHSIAAVAGAQTAIQQLPILLGKIGTIKILAPTYNEYANVFSKSGWEVKKTHKLEDLVGADCAVVVDPNNPTGKIVPPDELNKLAGQVGFLIVDESFMDVVDDLSMAQHSGSDNILVLKSFGKFFGLAGIRLGFVIGDDHYINKFKSLNGPWPVSGLAIHIAKIAFKDKDWVQKTKERLNADQYKLDSLCKKAGLNCLGGTPLFRLYEVDDAEAAQIRLARSFIWSRIFPWSKNWIRLGLPGSDEQWEQVKKAFDH